MKFQTTSANELKFTSLPIQWLVGLGDEVNNDLTFEMKGSKFETWSDQ